VLIFNTIVKDWVAMLLHELDRKKVDSLYAAPLREKIEKMLGQWSCNMDPKQYRKLYISKVYQEGFSVPSSSTAMKLTGNNSLVELQSVSSLGTVLQSSTTQSVLSKQGGVFPNSASAKDRQLAQ
jgi:hypothetical protein